MSFIQPLWRTRWCWQQANELDASSVELRFEFGESTELGGADWGIVLWVREEDDPVVADEFVEVDWALGGLGLEIRSNTAQA